MRMVTAGFLVLCGLAALGVAIFFVYDWIHTPIHPSVTIGSSGMHTHLHEGSWWPIGAAFAASMGCFKGAYSAWKDA